jgi:peptidoglycan hydrolase-like protein with peptidoglycan-binding domain
MSPGVLRLIFGGFALVLTGLAVNTLLLQPDVSSPLASAAPKPPAAAAIAQHATPVPKAVTANPSPAAAQTPKVAAVMSAPVRADNSAASKDTVRVAHLAPDATQPPRMPRLPEVEGDPDVILRVQKELLSRGYGPVVANGIIGPLSRAAVMAYEHDMGLPLTGEATEALLTSMRDGASPSRAPHADARKIRSPEAEQVVRTVQHSLTSLGYEPGRIDGRIGDDTERAIRTFEAANAMQPTGRVSAELFSLLARAMGARSAKAASQ